MTARIKSVDRAVVDCTYMCTHEENQLREDRPNRPVVDRTYKGSVWERSVTARIKNLRIVRS